MSRSYLAASLVLILALWVACVVPGSGQPQIDVGAAIDQAVAGTVKVLDRDGNGTLEPAETRRLDANDPNLWVGLAGVLSGLFGLSRAGAAQKRLVQLTDELYDATHEPRK